MRNYTNAAMLYQSIIHGAKLRAAEHAQNATQIVYRVVLDTEMASTLPQKHSSAGVAGPVWRNGNSGSSTARRARLSASRHSPSISIPFSASLHQPESNSLGMMTVARGTDSLALAILPDTERYLIQVMPFGDGVGCYQVAVNLIEGLTLELDEPTGGMLRESGATDIWRFDGQPDQPVIVEARSADFDPMVRLFSPTGNELTWDDDSGVETDSFAVAILPDAGQYLVHVTAFGDGTGDYDVNVGTVHQALALDRPTEGRLTDSGGTGLWLLEGEKGQEITVEAHSEDFDTVVRLIASTGEELIWDDDSGTGTNSLAVANLPDIGNYLVQVMPFNEKWFRGLYFEGKRAVAIGDRRVSKRSVCA